MVLLNLSSAQNFNWQLTAFTKAEGKLQEETKIWVVIFLKFTEKHTSPLILFKILYFCLNTFLDGSCHSIKQFWKFSFMSLFRCLLWLPDILNQFKTQFLSNININVYPHPDYSPDLVLCKFWLFTRKDTRFKLTEDIKAAVIFQRSSWKTSITPSECDKNDEINVLNAGKSIVREINENVFLNYNLKKIDFLFYLLQLLIWWYSKNCHANLSQPVN